MKSHADFHADPVGFLRFQARAGGDLATFRLGRQPYVLVSDPAAIHAVLETRAGSFAKRRGKQLLGDGLLTSEGEHHRRQRPLVAPAFHGQRIATYGRIVVEETESLGWAPGQVVDLDHAMPELMLRVIGRLVFGERFATDVPAISSALEPILALSSRITHPWAGLLNVLPLPSNLAGLAAKRRLDRLVYRRIRAGDGEILALLRDAGMPERQVRDEALTLLLAGNETTSTALTWTFYLLGTHPEQLAAVHAEVDALAEAPATADLPKLARTRQAVTEAMRLYPPAWALWRNALEDVEVPGGTIPRGSVAVVAPAVVHHDERHYPEPARFDPTRWEGAGKAKRPRYAYFPFGGGERSCIGEPLAWLSLVLVVATLARKWRLAPLPDQDLTLEPLITLRPRHGLKVRLEAR